MNTREIDSLLKKSCKKTFQGVFSVDTLPDKPRLMVVYTDKSTTVKEHCIAEFVDEKVLWDYFDSFDRVVEGTFKHLWTTSKNLP